MEFACLYVCVCMCVCVRVFSLHPFLCMDVLVLRFVSRSQGKSNCHFKIFCFVFFTFVLFYCKWSLRKKNLKKKKNSYLWNDFCEQWALSVEHWFMYSWFAYYIILIYWMIYQLHLCSKAVSTTCLLETLSQIPYLYDRIYTLLLISVINDNVLTNFWFSWAHH